MNPKVTLLVLILIYSTFSQPFPLGPAALNDNAQKVDAP